jgi:hypothetical protein
MEISRLLKEKIDTQMASWNAEIEAAEAKAKARQAQAEAEAADAELDEAFWARVKDLRARVLEGRQYLAELADAGDEQAERIKKKLSSLFE